MIAAPRHSPVDPGPSKPGERARHQLLEAAGEVFAEKGYSQATSKEICERAGMNSASVNYHFGGFEALYAETLAHAHRRLVAIGAIRDIAESRASSREKLRAIVVLFVRRLALSRTSWEVRILSREFVSSSPAGEAFFRSEILPKMDILRVIVASLVGAPPDDPVVGRALLAVVSPGMMLAIADRGRLTRIIPGLEKTSEEIDPLIEHLVLFIHAGLAAVAAEHASQCSLAKRSAPGSKQGPKRKAEPLLAKTKARRQAVPKTRN